MLFTQKTLQDNEWRVVSPEKDLWVSVLSRAALDAIRGPTRIERDQACSFFLKGGRHFRNVCEMAGRNPDYVQQKDVEYTEVSIKFITREDAKEDMEKIKQDILTSDREKNDLRVPGVKSFKYREDTLKRL